MLVGLINEIKMKQMYTTISMKGFNQTSEKLEKRKVQDNFVNNWQYFLNYRKMDDFVTKDKYIFDWGTVMN